MLPLTTVFPLTVILKLPPFWFGLAPPLAVIDPPAFTVRLPVTPSEPGKFPYASCPVPVIRRFSLIDTEWLVPIVNKWSSVHVPAADVPVIPVQSRGTTENAGDDIANNAAAPSARSHRLEGRIVPCMMKPPCLVVILFSCAPRGRDALIAPGALDRPE
jgi:hypothetical protein